MDYLDFELQLTAKTDGVYQVEVLHSPAGEVNATMRLPFEQEEITQHLKVLETMRSIDSNTRKTGEVRRGERQPYSIADSSAAAQYFGKGMFEAMLSPEVRASYRTSLSEARKKGKGLRLLLRIQAPELATLPWEYLYDETEGDYFCLSTETPLVRYLEVGRAQEQLEIKPPLRILGMVASPTDLATLDVEGEKRLMIEAIDQVTDRGYAELEWIQGQTWRDLQTAMRKGPWHVFHFYWSWRVRRGSGGRAHCIG